MKDADEAIDVIRFVQLKAVKFGVDFGLLSRKAISARTVNEITLKTKYDPHSISAISLLELVVKDILLLNPKDIALELTRQRSEALSKLTINELLTASIKENYSRIDCPILFQMKEDFNKMVSKNESTNAFKDRHKNRPLSINLNSLTNEKDNIITESIKLKTIRKSKSLNLNISNEIQTNFVSEVCVERWDLSLVIKWLEHISMNEHIDKFKKEAIDDYSLTELTGDHLKEMGIDKLGHRIKIIKSIERLQSLKNKKSN